VKNENLSALIVCLFLLLIIVVPLWFLTPILIKQTFEIYKYIQREDILSYFKTAFPSFFSSPELSQNMIIATRSFTSKIASSILNNLTEILLNFPTILLHLVLILFVFFFGLRDGRKLVSYMQSISPLSRESEKKIFKQFKDITHSVIFGLFLKFQTLCF